MMLLTSCPINMKLKEIIWRIVEIYLTRWKCDESFRYIKQCYNLEDIRVRHYTSIRNVVVLILAVVYFAFVYLKDNLKLTLLVERVYLVSKRFFGVPPSSTMPLPVVSTIFSSLTRAVSAIYDGRRNLTSSYSSTSGRRRGRIKLRKHQQTST